MHSPGSGIAEKQNVFKVVVAELRARWREMFVRLEQRPGPSFSDRLSGPKATPNTEALTYLRLPT